MKDFNYEKILKQAYDGEDIKRHAHDMMRAFYKKQLNILDVISLAMATDDDWFIGFTAGNLARRLDRQGEGGAILRFMLWSHGRGVERDLIDSSISKFIDSIVNDRMYDPRQPQIHRLQMLWDANVEIPLEKFGPLLAGLVNYNRKPDKNRAYEAALNMFVDLNAKEGNAQEILSLFDSSRTLNLQAALFRIVDVEMLEQVNTEVVAYSTSRIETRIINFPFGSQVRKSPDTAINLLERMARKGLDVSPSLELLDSVKDEIVDFEVRFPNLSFLCDACRRGLINNEEFDRSFRGPKAMMEKRKLGPGQKPIKRRPRPVAGSI